MKMDENTGSKTQFFSAMGKGGCRPTEGPVYPGGTNREGQAPGQSFITFIRRCSIEARGRAELGTALVSLRESFKIADLGFGTPRRLAFAYAYAIERRGGDDVIVPATSTTVP